MRLGIAGIGYWGKKVVREYIRLLDEGKIDSLAIYDIEKNKLFNTKVIPYHEFDRFMDGVDAIHICTNNESHYPLALEALRNGKHVLIEKPMTINSDDAYRLVEVADEYGCILQVGHIFRFANVIRYAKRLYEEGYFGNVYHMRFSWKSYNPYNSIDIVWDLSPHPIDILNFITGKWPKRISCIAMNCNANTFIHAKLDSMLITIELSFLYPLKERRLEIIGSKRSAIIDCVEQLIDIYPTDTISCIEVNNTIREEALNFINSIKSKRSPFNSAIIGARTVSLIEEIVNSKVCLA